MEIYLNPMNDDFEETIPSEIYVDSGESWRKL